MLSQSLFNIFMTFFYRTFKLKISLNLKQYYNSRFNGKIIKSFKKIIDILSNLLYLYWLVFYICLIEIDKVNFQLGLNKMIATSQTLS